MKKGGFSQLPVFDKETGNWGIVTEFTIMKRMLSPLKSNKETEKKSIGETTKFNWLNEFKSMPINEAMIIDEAPIFPLETSIAEIAQALLFHYAVLIIETRGKIGLVTREPISSKKWNSCRARYSIIYSLT